MGSFAAECILQIVVTANIDGTSAGVAVTLCDAVFVGAAREATDGVVLRICGRRQGSDDGECGREMHSVELSGEQSYFRSVVVVL